MKRVLLLHGAVAIAILAITIGVQAASDQPSTAKTGIDPKQIPKWSADDLDFFCTDR